MKRKIILTLVSVAVVAALAACDTKACQCYDYTADGAVPNTVYTDASNPCSVLNRGTDGTYGSRVCTETNEPQPDPSSIATK